VPNVLNTIDGQDFGYDTITGGTIPTTDGKTWTRLAGNTTWTIPLGVSDLIATYGQGLYRIYIVAVDNVSPRGNIGLALPNPGVPADPLNKRVVYEFGLDNEAPVVTKAGEKVETVSGDGPNSSWGDAFANGTERPFSLTFRGTDSLGLASVVITQSQDIGGGFLTPITISTTLTTLADSGDITLPNLP
jgi:hypothetical protein